MSWFADSIHPGSWDRRHFLLSAEQNQGFPEVEEAQTDASNLGSSSVLKKQRLFKLTGVQKLWYILNDYICRINTVFPQTYTYGSSLQIKWLLSSLLFVPKQHILEVFPGLHTWIHPPFCQTASRYRKEEMPHSLLSNFSVARHSGHFQWQSTLLDVPLCEVWAFF